LNFSELLRCLLLKLLLKHFHLINQLRLEVSWLWFFGLWILKIEWVENMTIKASLRLLHLNAVYWWHLNLLKSLNGLNWRQFMSYWFKIILLVGIDMVLMLVLLVRLSQERGHKVSLSHIVTTEILIILRRLTVYNRLRTWTEPILLSHIELRSSREWILSYHVSCWLCFDFSHQRNLSCVKLGLDLGHFLTFAFLGQTFMIRFILGFLALDGRLI